MNDPARAEARRPYVPLGPHRHDRRSAARAHRQLRGRRHRPPRRGASARRRSSRRSWRARTAQTRGGAAARRRLAEQGGADAARDGARRHRATCRSTSRCSTRASALDARVRRRAAVCRRARAAATATSVSARPLADGGFDYVTCSSRRACTAARNRRAGVASRRGTARRGVGQPAPVGARHPGVVPAALPDRTCCSARSATSAATC